MLLRGGSDLWLPFAGAIFVFPAATVVLAQPEEFYPRYLLISVLFLQLLLSGLLARLYRRPRYGRVVYLVVLCLILVGNGAWTARLLTSGRGGYQAALRLMLDRSTDPDLTVSSDHDFRNRLVLQYYFDRSGSTRRLIYYSMDQIPQAGPEWVLIHSQEQEFSPPHYLRDRFGNEYALEAAFPYAGLSECARLAQPVAPGTLFPTSCNSI